MADTEKVTINMSVVDLGQIDLLAEQGFYSSRTDFIRTAIRRQLDGHAEDVRRTVARKTSVVGAMVFGKAELEQLVADGKHLDIRVVGLLALGKDVTPELAQAAIQSIEVHGVFRASSEVKTALAGRIR